MLLNKLRMIWLNQSAGLSAVIMISKSDIAAVYVDGGNKQC